MDRYPPGSRTPRHAGPRCYTHPHVTIGPAAGYLGSYPLDDSAIAPGSAQTLSARSRQPQPDRQPLFLKTRSSHYLLHVVHCAINHNEVLVHGDTFLRLAPSNGIPCFELIVISVMTPAFLGGLGELEDHGERGV